MEFRGYKVRQSRYPKCRGVNRNAGPLLDHIVYGVIAKWEAPPCGPHRERVLAYLRHVTLKFLLQW